jgi:hypothetical protein
VTSGTSYAYIDGGAPIALTGFTGQTFSSGGGFQAGKLAWNPSNYFNGYLAEIALAQGDQSANVGAIYANQAAYFGNFPI